MAVVTASNTQPTIVKNEAVQVLYIGAENPITLRVNHYKPSELSAKVSTGTLHKTNDAGSYNWKICDTKATTATIKLYCGKQFIKSFRFLLKLSNPEFIPTGHPIMRGEGGRSISGTDALKFGFNDDRIPEVKCTVISFHVSFHSDSTIVELDNNGEEFNAEVKKIINITKPGAILFIDKIMVRVGCDPALREMLPIRYDYF